MTETRMIFHYLQWIVYPSIEQYGLYHDDIRLSQSLRSPMTTLFSLIGLAALTVLALVSRKTLPWLGFGIGFFLLGHSLESTVFPLELVFEHRNYLPSLGIVMVLVLAAQTLIRRNNISAGVYLSVAVAIFVFVCSMTYLRSIEWSSFIGQMRAAAERHPHSARTQWSVGMWYLQEHSDGLAIGLDSPNMLADGRRYALRASQVDPNYISAYFALVLYYYHHDLVADAHWFAELTRRLEVGHFGPENDNNFTSLVACVKSDTCYADMQEVDMIFAAALKNETLGDKMRRSLLSRYSLFYYEQQHYRRSYDLLIEAEALQSTARGIRNLTVLSIDLGDKSLASKHLLALKRLDGDKDSQEIQRLQEYVEQCCESQ